MTSEDWQEIKVGEHYRPWRAVFNSDPFSEDLTLPCPICGQATLHSWFHQEDERAMERLGRRYVGRGELWEWCSSCHTFEHYRDANVPEEWHSDLSVPVELLTHNPGAIESARKRRRADEA